MDIHALFATIILSFLFSSPFWTYMYFKKIPLNKFPKTTKDRWIYSSFLLGILSGVFFLPLMRLHMLHYVIIFYLIALTINIVGINDAILIVIKDFFNKTIMIPIFIQNSFHNKNCIFELFNSKNGIYILCYDKRRHQYENWIEAKDLYKDINEKVKPRAHYLYILKSIENSSDLISFYYFLYENYSNLSSFSCYDFLQIIDKRKLFLRTRLILEPDKKYKNLQELLEYNNIDLTPKKLDINSATEDEITELPFINAIQSKKIIMYIFEKGGFKTFWEFANFLNLTKNQVLVLSKLVEIKSKEIIGQNVVENNNSPEREVDL